MTSGYILIAAIFILGGIIAASGDRLGTKIGKARLRLFNLRPRQTAMVITFITGMLVSASTLGILFGLSESLRIGIFKLDDILKELRHTKEDLVQVNQQKQQVESQLTTVQDKQVEAVGQLDAINLDFQRSKEQLKTISSRANKLRSELDNLLVEREKQLQQLEQLKGQSQQLQSQLQEREEKIVAQDKILSEKETRLQQLKGQQQVLQTQVLEQDKSIANLDQQIALKDRNLQLRTSRLKDLESQLKFLDREVSILEEYYQTYQELRESKIAIVKGQVLSSAVVRIVDPSAAISAIDSLLRQANSNVLKAIEFQGGESLSERSQQRVVKITKAEVKQLASQIKDGKDYVLRILSAGNYVQGEKDIRVFADLAVNQEIFKAGDEIATVSIDSERLTRSEVQERLNWLLAVAKFRAQRAGALGDIQIGDGQVATIVDFIDKITESEESVDEIQALVVETTYTAGPLKLNLVVIHNGKIVFST